MVCSVDGRIIISRDEQNEKHSDGSSVMPSGILISRSLKQDEKHSD
jgi:hypothetical protein